MVTGLSWTRGPPFVAFLFVLAWGKRCKALSQNTTELPCPLDETFEGVLRYQAPSEEASVPSQVMYANISLADLEDYGHLHRTIWPQFFELCTGQVGHVARHIAALSRAKVTKGRMPEERFEKEKEKWIEKN